MRCSRSQYLYEEYIAGTLAPATAARVDEHLAACAACRDFYETNDDIAELITDGNEIAHPGDVYLSDLKSRVMGSLTAGRAGDGGGDTPIDLYLPVPRRWPRHLLWAVPAAAALFIAITAPPVLQLLRPGTPSGADGAPSGDAGPVVASAVASGDARASDEEPTGETASVEAASAAGSATTNDIENYPLRRIVLERTGLRPQTVSSAPSAGVRNTTPPVQAAPVARGGHSISKGVRRPAPPETVAADAGAADARTVGVSGSAARMTPSEFIVSLFRSGSSIPSGRNAAGEAEYVTVRIPPHVLRQIIMHDVKGTPESRAEMYSLVREIGRAVAELQVPREEMDDPTFYQQYRDFHRAERFLTEGKPADAAKIYEAVIAEDPDSTVAGQALYRLAGIRFDELGEFEAARELYGRFGDRNLASTLNDAQREELQRRLEMLDRHEASRWGPLRCRNKVSSGSWADAGEALWSLSRLGDPVMLQDAGRLFVERLGRDPGPDRPTASRLIASLKRLVDQTEDTRCRAWLSLALGDLVMRYESAQFGLQHFNSVVILDEQSVAAGIARDRLHRIRTLPVSGQ